MFILTTHAHQRAHERAIDPDEIAVVTRAARGLIEAIPAGVKVPLFHRGITVVVAGGGVVVSCWRRR